MVRIREQFPHRVGREDVRIPLADGTRLYARTWRPVTDEPVPALLEYLPDRLTDSTWPRDAQRHPWYAGHGYASVRVDVRGNGNSDGTMTDEYTELEILDGVEVVEWLAAQPWCDGNVGMFGVSWGGINALQVAGRAPEALKAIVTVCSTDDRYDNDAHYLGGSVLGVDMHAWAAMMLAYTARPPDPRHVGAEWRERWLARLEGLEPYIHTWLAHQERDEYWRHGSVREDYGAIRAAVLAVGGWHDPYRDTVFRLIEHLDELGTPVRGIVGPWAHQYPDLESPPGPAIGFLQETLRWWDQWLKGVDRGVLQEPLLRSWINASVPPATTYAERPGRWVGDATWPSSQVAMTEIALAPPVDTSTDQVSEAASATDGVTGVTEAASEIDGSESPAENGAEASTTATGDAETPNDAEASGADESESSEASAAAEDEQQRSASASTSTSAGDRAAMGGADGADAFGAEGTDASAVDGAESPAAWLIPVRSPQHTGVDAGRFLPIGNPGDLPPDQRDDDGRSLCFDTAPLGGTLEILGRARLRLRLRCEAERANVIARLCDVAPGGASTLVTRGALNLVSREGRDRNVPWVAGDRGDVEFELSAAGHAFPAGHRIRVALSSAYWPWIWPHPEGAGFDVDAAGSALYLPVRDARPDAGRPPVAFEPAEQAEPLPMRPQRIGDDRPFRAVARDVATGLWAIDVDPNYGGSRVYPDGLQCTEVARDRYWIRQDDPLSARARSDWRLRLRREDIGWDVRVIAMSETSCTAHAFLVENGVKCYDGEELVFERSWRREIPR